MYTLFHHTVQRHPVLRSHDRRSGGLDRQAVARPPSGGVTSQKIWRRILEWLGNPVFMFGVGLFMLFLFGTLFYQSAQLEKTREVVIGHKVNSERILSADSEATAAVRLAVVERAERYLVDYDYLRQTQKKLMEDTINSTSDPEILAIYADLKDTLAYVEEVERWTISAVKQADWSNGRKAINDKAYKQEKGLYRAKLSRALQSLIKEGEQKEAFAKKMVMFMQIGSTTFLVIVLFFALAYSEKIKRASRIQERLSKRLEVANEELEAANENLEKRIEERTQELNETLSVVSASINYASHIQRSLLPRNLAFQRIFSEYFVLWEPRDVVGGDMYLCRPWGSGTLVVLGDCTGHGVPGAFMTMISDGAIKRATREVPAGKVSALLRRLHQMLQSSLGQVSGDCETSSDDGIELGACYISADFSTLTFAGARFDLYIRQAGEIQIVRGDRVGLGYCRTPHDVEISQTEIALSSTQTFYMTSDGLIDQIGGPQHRSFGKKRFLDLLETLADVPLAEQEAAIAAAVLDYQGEETRRDDLSVMGFRCPAHT